MSDPRIAALIEQIERLAAGDLMHRGEPSEAQDELDACIVGLNIVADDLLTEQRNGQRIEADQRDMADLFEHAPALLCAVDLESGAVAKANATMVSRHGPTRASMLGAPFRDFVAKTARDVADEALTRLRAGVAVHDLELMLVGCDGTEYLGLFSATPVRGDGGFVRARCTVIDIDSRRGLERQLLEMQKLESIGRLAGGIAHDFNNLLTVIQNHTEFALGEVAADSEAAEDLATVLEAGRRAARLTSQLLAFSRRQESRPIALRLTDAVRDLHRMMTSLLGETVQVALVLPDRCSTTIVDPGHIEQIVMNLAVNARDAMPSGGTITIEVREVEAAADPASPDETRAYVALCIEDEGQGMAPDVVARVFEPFFTTKEVGRGTGLGLATCYGLARQAGGFIRVQSTLGRGSRFEVLLPRSEDEASPTVSGLSPALSEPSVGGVETILLAEDDEQVRTLVSRILRAAGYRVLAVADGDAACRTIEAHVGELDMLVTDVVLPGLSGTRVAEELRSRRPSVPVLYLSGYPSDAHAVRETLDTHAEFISKPFQPQDLLITVRASLDGARASSAVHSRR